MTTVRYWAAARAATGVAEEQLEAQTLAEVLGLAADRHGRRLSEVLARCSYLVDSDPVGRRDPSGVLLTSGAVVDVLPPFAGG